MPQDTDLIHMPDVMPSTDVVSFLEAHQRPVLLSFSAGKDAVAAWLALRDRVKIVPFYCFLIPNLEFVEQGLRYYEDFFGQRIIRVPHPALYRWLNELTFQAPQNCQIIEDAALPDFDFSQLEQCLREDYNLPPDSYAATGVRAADSPNRRSGLKRNGPIVANKLKAWPVWDWRMSKLEKEFIRSGVKLTIDYELFGRSFDGLDYRFLKPIKDRFPDDYARILEWFPLAELEIFRTEHL